MWSQIPAKMGYAKPYDDDERSGTDGLSSCKLPFQATTRPRMNPACNITFIHISISCSMTGPGQDALGIHAAARSVNFNFRKSAFGLSLYHHTLSLFLLSPLPSLSRWYYSIQYHPSKPSLRFAKQDKVPPLPLESGGIFRNLPLLYVQLSESPCFLRGLSPLS